MKRLARKIVLPALLIFAAGVFGTGINWGLPSRREDRYLLGKDYHGLRLDALTAQVPQVDAARGVDVVTSAAPSYKIVALNDTDLKKAQILCRYRLYSDQPDEMITFRALSQMQPSHWDFDPRLYQYGGLWIYPVAALIEAGHALGFLDLGDRSLYIGNPEIFAKFYVTARAYSAAWGLIGVCAVFFLTRRISGGQTFLPAAGALCFICMPVVVDMAHEAKPHLAGAVLVLLAVLAGDHYLSTARMKWLWITGLLCGAAAGMVLWGLVAWILLPVIAWRTKRLFPLLCGMLAAISFYALTNPYVIFHLLHDPSVLRSNLGNTSAMYPLGLSFGGLWNALELVVAGTGPVILLAALIGIILLSRRKSSPALLLLLAVAIATIIPFAAMAAGKTGEYARFALLPDAALAIIAISWLGIFKGRFLRRSLALIIAAATACYGGPYLAGFLRDSSGAPRGTRELAAEEIDHTLLDWRRTAAAFPENHSLQIKHWTLGVYSDPAPYCLPPVDLDRWTIVRLPKDFDEVDGRFGADLIVRPDQTLRPWLPGYTPISWANKRFVLIEGGAYDLWSPGQPSAASNVEPPAASGAEP